MSKLIFISSPIKSNLMLYKKDCLILLNFQFLDQNEIFIFNSIILVFGLEKTILANPAPCKPIIVSALLNIKTWSLKL